MQRQWLGRTVVAAACVALLAAGCGGDDDEQGTPSSGNPPTTPPTTAAPAADPAAYCTAEAAIEVAPAADTSQAVSDEEVASVLQQWATQTLQPLVGPVVAAAPDDVSAEIRVMADAVDQLSASGDATALQSPEFLAATDTVHAYDLATCGWGQVDVTTTEYRFDGIPAEVPAGVTSFEVANSGAEPHELRIFRKADGVTTAAAELLALGEDGMAGQAEMVGTGEFVDPADDGYFVADLAPGDYFAACFVPVGATSDAGPPDPDAPHHFDEGMVSEFTVTGAAADPATDPAAETATG
jgi:hypothetical protein